MKKIIALLVAFVSCLTAFALTGCDQKYDVYYLNFKPEVGDQWTALAKDYQKETGVKVKVSTVASGKYEETLRAQIGKSNAPTLFQISGSVGYENWKDYCLDLSGSDVYKQVTSDDFVVKSGNGVYGIAYVYEGYGLVVNKTLLAKTTYTIDQINSYAKLKEVSEYVTTNKATLGFSAFTSAGLDPSSSWRFSGHLANLPLFYEFKEDNITTQPATIKGTYLAQFRNVWDLYVNNATCEGSALGAKTGDDSVAEFKNGQALFYQNGTWSYNDIKSIGDANIGYLPIYLGVDDAKEGLACGTENYWAVNSQASKEQQEATLKFLNWVVTSERGTKALAEEMGFVSPFKQAKSVANVLCNEMNKYVANGCYNVNWTGMNLTPNTEAWRAPVVTALGAYATASAADKDAKWNDVETAFVGGWATQYTESHK